MKYWTNKNKKALLHSLPFAILLALCFKTYAQAPGSQLDLTNDDMVAQEHYRESLRNCSSQFVSAQCQREAHLAFKSTKHSIQIKRRATTAQLKQEKSLKIIALDPASMEASARKALLKKTPHANSSRLRIVNFLQQHQSNRKDRCLNIRLRLGSLSTSKR